jgi:hypothetical protein
MVQFVSQILQVKGAIVPPVASLQVGQLGLGVSPQLSSGFLASSSGLPISR